MTATVLTITPQGAELSVCEKRTAISTQHFPDCEAGWHDLGEQLHSFRQVPLSVLVNTQDEDFRLECLPHTNGPEKTQLWQRKLEQLYSDTFYTCIEKQGRTRARAEKSNELLFSALTNPLQLTRWLEPVLRNKIPIRGIYSLPLVSEMLSKRLAPKDDYVLLLTLDEASGLRQSFFVDGKLKFSRLLLEIDPHASTLGDFLSVEISNVRRHVENQQLLPRDQSLTVCLISSHADSSWLEMVNDALPLCRCQHFDVDGLLSRTTADDRDRSRATVTELFTHLILQAQPKHNFASTKEQTYWHQRRVTAGLYAASVIIVLASIVLSASYVTEAIQLRSSNPDLRITQNQLQNELDSAQKIKQALPALPAHLEQLVLTARTLDKNVTPAVMLRQLSQSLEQHPNIRFLAFKWLTMDHANAQADEYDFKPDSHSRILPIDNTGSTGQTIHQTAQLYGEVIGFEQDWQVAMDMVNAYIDTLRNTDQVERVGILKLPVNTDPKRYLSGSVQQTNHDGQTRQPAQFALRIVLKDGE